MARRTPKDASSFRLSTGLKTSFSGIRSAGRVKNAKARAADGLPLPELSLVRAVREIREGDETVPAGATGTIVHVIKGGIGYDVEFTAPKHVVISAGPDEIAPA